jgi:hypothetical protein
MFDPEVSEVLEAVISDVLGLAGPGRTVTVGSVESTALPAIVAPTVVADPARTPVKFEE